MIYLVFIYVSFEKKLGIEKNIPNRRHYTFKTIHY